MNFSEHGLRWRRRLDRCRLYLRMDYVFQMNIEHHSVLGLDVAACTSEQALSQFENWALAGDRAYGVSFADVHVVARARQDKDFGKCMRKFDAVMPDGKPVLWSVNRHLSKSQKLSQRVSGPDMFRRFQEFSASRPELRHFYLGGSPKLLESVVHAAKLKCPGISISGYHSPPFREWTPEDRQEILRNIADSGANVIWVGLGCPKQETWIAENLSHASPGVFMAVGAAFAFYVGTVKRAPLWMQKCGIEWIHRLISEPRRLWKRYMVYNSLFVYHTIMDSLKAPRNLYS